VVGYILRWFISLQSRHPSKYDHDLIPLLEEILSNFQMDIILPKTRMMGADRVILARFV